MVNGLHLFRLLFMIWLLSYNRFLQQPTTFSNAEFPLFVTWKIGKDQRLRGETKIIWNWILLGFMIVALAKACNQIGARDAIASKNWSLPLHMCVLKHQAALGPSMTWSCIMVWGSMPSLLPWRTPGEYLAPSCFIQAQSGLLGLAPWPEKSSLASKCLCLSSATLRLFSLAAFNLRYGP